MAAVEISRPWLDNYPPGVPHALAEDSYGTLLDIFDESVRKYADRPALDSFGVRMSYGELGRVAEKIAAALQVAGL